MKYYSIQSGRKGFAQIQPEIRSAIENEIAKANNVFPGFKEAIENIDLNICFGQDGVARYDPDLQIIYLDVNGIETALVPEVVRALDEHYSSMWGVLFSFTMFEGKTAREFGEADHSSIHAIQNRFAGAVSYVAFSSEKFQLTHLQKMRLDDLEKDRKIVGYGKEFIHKIFLDLIREIRKTGGML